MWHEIAPTENLLSLFFLLKLSISARNLLAHIADSYSYQHPF
jgi:hypothetical protein